MPLPASPAPFALARGAIEVLPGTTSSVGIVGGTAPYAIVSAASSVASATVDPAGGPVVVAAGASGITTVHVSDASGRTATLNVLVGPAAGVVPSEIEAVLAGRPTPEFALAQIRAALMRLANLEPGARLVLGDALLPADLEPGVDGDLPLRVHIDGAGTSVDVDGFTNVHLTLQGAPGVAPSSLFYSDDPEKVATDGILFRSDVTTLAPSRLYYYHLAASAGHTVVVALQANAPGSVRVGGRGAGPNPAVLFVGQSATYRSLDDAERGAAVVLPIEPGAPLVLFTSDAALRAGDLIAGALDVSIVSGGDLRLTVAAVSDLRDVPQTLAGSVLPGDGRMRRGIYSLAGIAPLDLSVRSDEVDGDSATVGAKATALPNELPTGKPLAGDYGVARPVRLTLDNRGDAPHPFYLYERPIGYPVTTTIAFDGDPAPMRVPCVKTAAYRYLVRAFVVPARTVARVSATYMTDGGSTYPLAFGLTSSPPYAPPATMLGHDGCFEKRGR